MTAAQLVLAIHCHQPVGNPDAATARAHDRAYRPLVDALGRHPQVRAGLYLSGPLLEWLESHQPGLVSDVRALVERGQIELLGGALQAAELSSLSDRDAVGQLEAMSARLRELFEVEARGVWLGGWTPELPRLLAPSGLRFAFVDGAPGAGDGYVAADHGGVAVALFAAKAHASAEELRGLAKDGRLAVVCVDGAELGALQDGDHGLDAFFESLAGLESLTPSEVLTRRPPQGRTVSLPPEAATLRARMLHASKKIAEAEAELGETERLQAARAELYKGQGHDAYGAGRLQPELRHAAYAALIRADNLVDAETRGEGDFIEYEEDDLDADLRDEALLANAQVAAWVDPDAGGALYELDFRPLATCVTHLADPDGPRLSFVDRFHAPGFGLEQLQRGSDGDLGDFAGKPYAIEASGVDEEGDLSASVTLMRESQLALPDGPRKLVVEKTFHVPIDAARLEAEYILENPSDAPLAFTFAPELNLTLLSSAEPERYLELPDGKRASLSARLNHGATRGARLIDEQRGVALELELDRDAELWSYPVEAGGAYQGTCLLLRMAVTLPPGESARIVIRAELATVELEPETPETPETPEGS